MTVGELKKRLAVCDENSQVLFEWKSEDSDQATYSIDDVVQGNRESVMLNGNGKPIPDFTILISVD